MKNKKANLVKICKMWTPLAKEYIKFLQRYALDTVSMLSWETDERCHMTIYADEERYLNLSLNSNRFRAEERQLTELLSAIEMMYNVLEVDDFAYEEDFDDCDGYEDDEEYEEYEEF